MHQSSYAETIQHQYDSYIKKHLRGEAKSYMRDTLKHIDEVICFSDLSENELNQICSEDTFDIEKHLFRVMGFDIHIKDDLLGEALEYLNTEKRNILLLSYFLDMSDAEIGELLHIVRSTVFRNRKAALDKIKKYMEVKTDGK